MSNTHKHTPEIIVDSDVDAHFNINITTRAITNVNNKKLSLIQYDHNSERFSFDMDRYIEGHDMKDCNRIQIHFINTDSNNRSRKEANVYPVTDLEINPEDNSKVSFTWLISKCATIYAGALSFLISFECVNYNAEVPEILYRWNSGICNTILIAPGYDNNDTVAEIYSDQILQMQRYLEEIVIPGKVDECYIDRNFATSEEVATIFSLDSSDAPVVSVASVVQTTGQSTKDVMSQKAVTDSLNSLSVPDISNLMDKPSNDDDTDVQDGYVLIKNGSSSSWDKPQTMYRHMFIGAVDGNTAVVVVDSTESSLSSPKDAFPASFESQLMNIGLSDAFYPVPGYVWDNSGNMMGQIIAVSTGDVVAWFDGGSFNITSSAVSWTDYAVKIGEAV